MTTEAFPFRHGNLFEPQLIVPDVPSGGMTAEMARGKEKEKPFVWYHGVAAEKAFAASLNLDPKKPEDKHKVDTLGKVLESFLAEEINNVSVFTTSEGIGIPYTTINVTEFARTIRANLRAREGSANQDPSIRSFTHQASEDQEQTLTGKGHAELGKIMQKTYLAHGGQLTDEARTEISDRVGALYQKKEFLENGPHVYEKVGSPKPKDVTHVTFGSFLTPQNGHPFTYVEIALRQTMDWLGPLIKAMDEGREVPNVQVLTLGSPFNDRWGSITEEYGKRVEQDPFNVLGASYAELVASTLPESGEDRANTQYRFYGHSMGGRLATATAEALTNEGGAFSQETQVEEKAHLQTIYIDSTPGWNKKKVPGQISIGFGLFVAQEARHNPKILSTIGDEKDFLKYVEKYSSVSTLTNREQKEQLAWKKAALGAIKQQLSEPVTASGVEVTHWKGTSDPVIYSRKWNKDMQKREEETGVPVRRVEPLKTYEWATEGSHQLSGFYPPWELEKWNKSLDVLLGTSS